MSWPRTQVLCGVVVALLLSGCGFQPLYGTNNAGSGASADLATVYISSISNRDGQLLRNALTTRFNPRGEPDHPAFVLDVVFVSAESHVALQKDTTASRAQVSYTANYQLTQGRELVAIGKTTRQVSYDFLQERYSDVVAGQDARNHAVQSIADEIRNEIAAYFVRRQQAGIGAGPGIGR